MDLRQRADNLFKENFGDIKQDAYLNYQNRYWSEIFKDEFNTVKERNETEKLKLAELNSPPMIITLGASPEPIVLAVHLVSPSKIYVIYNQEKHLEAFKKGLEATKNTNNFVNNIKAIHLGQSHHEAADLFKLLRGKKASADDNVSKSNLKELLQIIDDESQRKRIIFDITGAKKTISSGCFLFAAYADIPVYYMDFDNDINAYHPDLGKPYPGRCFYTRQKNPVTAFAIREFQELENAFNERRFNDVFKGIGRVIQTMDEGKKDGFFDQDEIDLLWNMCAVSDIYSDWQDGAYGSNNEKKNLYKRLKEINGCLSISNLLNNLSSYPSPSAQYKSMKNADYFNDINSFCSYITIELARLKRKIPIPNQHLFLKLFCFEEFIISFIWWKLINNSVKVYNARNNCEISKPDKRNLVNANYGKLEEYLTEDIDNNYTPQKNHRVGNYLEVTFTRPPIKEIFTNNQVSDILWKFRGNPCGGDYFQKKITRSKRDDTAHFTISIDDNEVNILIENAEKLWKYILNNKKDWFLVDGNSIADRFLNLMCNPNWHEKPEVAPLKWKEVKEIIEKDMKHKKSIKAKKYGDIK
jgi:hypothetical protein